MKTFNINGKEYNTKAFDFNTVCDLEDMGIALEEAGKKPMSMVRAYFTLCAGHNKEYAGKELEEHLAKGGDMTDIINAMTAAMEESDFFRTLSEKTQKATFKIAK